MITLWQQGTADEERRINVSVVLFICISAADQVHTQTQMRSRRRRFAMYKHRRPSPNSQCSVSQRPKGRPTLWVTCCKVNDKASRAALTVLFHTRKFSTTTLAGKRARCPTKIFVAVCAAGIGHDGRCHEQTSIANQELLCCGGTATTSQS